MGDEAEGSWPLTISLSGREPHRDITFISPFWKLLEMPLDSVLRYGPYTVGMQRNPNNMDSLKTGELAKQAGVNVETLRFYEREGLLAEPPRRASGYREYPPDTVQRIRFVQRAKELGFTLREIKGLLELRVDPYTTCAEVKSRAAEKIADVKQKISDLKSIERALDKLINNCRGSGPIDECPILKHLEKEL